MGPPSRSFAAEAHLLLHGPDPRADLTEYKVAARASRPMSELSSVRPVSTLRVALLRAWLDSGRPIQALTGRLIIRPLQNRRGRFFVTTRCRGSRCTETYRTPRSGQV